MKNKSKTGESRAPGFVYLTPGDTSAIFGLVIYLVLFVTPYKRIEILGT